MVPKMFEPLKFDCKAHNKAKMCTQEKQSVETLADPGIVKQQHWNTGAKDNHQLIPDGPRNSHKNFRPKSPTNEFRSNPTKDACL